MGYKEPIAKNKFVQVSAHNRDEIAPGHAFALQYAPKPEIQPVEFFYGRDPAELRHVLSALVHHEVTKPDDGKGSFILFHQSPLDSKSENLINSKLPKLYFHIVSGDLGEDYQHIQNEKTYVPHPHTHELLQYTKGLANEKKGFHLRDVPSDAKEAEIHKILFHPGYSDLSDFVSTAGSYDLSDFSSKLVDAMMPLARNSGGARVIIDSRLNPDDFFTAHIIGGEYLGQEPEPTHRWFNMPKAPAA